jgi:hypothetical protein
MVAGFTSTYAIGASSLATHRLLPFHLYYLRVNLKTSILLNNSWGYFIGHKIINAISTNLIVSFIDWIITYLNLNKKTQMFLLAVVERIMKDNRKFCVLLCCYGNYYSII